MNEFGAFVRVGATIKSATVSLLNEMIDTNTDFCPNCGAKVNKEDKEVVNATVVENNSNPTVKDNTTIAFVCSIIGALCCTYVAIPGMILSIQSLKQMNEGKISNEKKWMAIAGIVLSAIGLITMIWNFTHMDQANQRVQDLINQFNDK